MSWADNKAVLKAVFDELDYTEIEKVLDLEDTAVTKSDYHYTLKPIGLETASLTNLKVIGVDLIQMDIIYKTKDNAERDEKFDAFRTLAQALFELTNFQGWLLRPTFTRFVDNTNYYKGTLTFIYGVHGC